MAFAKCFSQEPTSGFNDLPCKRAGDGKEGNCWATAAGRNHSGMTWLGRKELRELEALGDTLLPGFEAGDDATVEQVCTHDSFHQSHAFAVSVGKRRVSKDRDQLSTFSVPSKRSAATCCW